MLSFTNTDAKSKYDKFTRFSNSEYNPGFSQIGCLVAFVIACSYIAFFVWPLFYAYLLHNTEITKHINQKYLISIRAATIFFIIYYLSIFFQSAFANAKLQAAPPFEYEFIKNNVLNRKKLICTHFISYVLFQLLTYIFLRNMLDDEVDFFDLAKAFNDGLKIHFFPFSVQSVTYLSSIFLFIYFFLFGTVFTRFIAVPFQFFIWETLPKNTLNK